MKHTIYKKIKTVLGFVIIVVPLICYSQTNSDYLHNRAPRIDAIELADGAVVGPLLNCNSVKVLGLLNILKKDINSCCIELENDFIGTFTILSDIKNTFTACCTIIQSDINGTFTTLSDVLTTLTNCCNEITNEFNQTWTILAAGFSNTFTAYFDFKSTLTTCCDQIETNFTNIFIALENLSAICQGSVCNAITITAPGTISIPGSYCLANDIIGSIIINANNVTFDLNNHTISGSGAGSGAGIILNAGSNRVVKNGRITNIDSGIVCNNNNQTILEGIVVETAFVEGITINNGNTILLDSLITTSVLGIGVHFTGNNNGTLINNTTVTLSQQGFVFDTITNSLIRNCNVLDCSTTVVTPLGTTVGGFTIINGSFIQFENCSVKNYIGVDSVAAFSLNNNVNNVIFKACTVQNIIATISSSFGSIAVGFNCGVTNTIQLLNCSVLDAAADLFAGGFLFTGSNIQAENCIARHFTTFTIPPSSGNSIGFQVTNNNVILKNCEAYECAQTGFFISPTGTLINVSLINCQAAYNNSGFSTQSAGTIFEQCVAFKNGTGFFSSVVGVSPFRCFSTQNTTNYGGSIVNVQNANTQVNNSALGLTGPFAGGNLFI